ncbi:unnamed protein product [Lactuca virosa]|uniref:Uncharacterized protein n=1 Tax=Lactuca virosa TaxID=75947 RepID=A0AAU9NBV2_9ASTR|nr:unnamed protein product [Lactuca virosa]
MSPDQDPTRISPLFLNTHTSPSKYLRNPKLATTAASMVFHHDCCFDSFLAALPIFIFSALEAFASSLRLRHRIPADVLATHPLVSTALSSLTSDVLSEEAVNGDKQV